MSFKTKNTPNFFLKMGGGVFLLIGALGFAGLIGQSWNATDSENYIRLALGSLMIVGGLTLSAQSQRTCTLVLGSGAILAIAATGFQVFRTGELLTPANFALHIVLACWALSAAIRRGTLPSLTTKGEAV